MESGGRMKTIGRDVTAREVMDEVLKDRIYYRRSGGGLTISGGEALRQPEFASALLRAAKENGISTAVESTGCAPFEKIQMLLPNLDLYLMDIKHINPDKHKEFTGVPTVDSGECPQDCTRGEKTDYQGAGHTDFCDTLRKSATKICRLLPGVEGFTSCRTTVWTGQIQGLAGSI